MTEATGEKKPAQGGCDEKPFISEEMLHAGWMKLYGLQGVDCANSLAEEVYTVMDAARQRALVARMTIGEMAITREMIGAGLRWLDSDDPAGAVKDVFEEMMKVVCTTPELRLAYLALLSESAQQGSATHPA